jgi:hypothetical protein
VRARAPVRARTQLGFGWRKGTAGARPSEREGFCPRKGKEKREIVERKKKWKKREERNLIPKILRKISNMKLDTINLNKIFGACDRVSKIF